MTRGVTRERYAMPGKERKRRAKKVVIKNDTGTVVDATKRVAKAMAKGSVDVEISGGGTTVIDMAKVLADKPGRIEIGSMRCSGAGTVSITKW